MPAKPKKVKTPWELKMEYHAQRVKALNAKLAEVGVKPRRRRLSAAANTTLDEERPGPEYGHYVREILAETLAAAQLAPPERPMSVPEESAKKAPAKRKAKGKK